MKLGNRVVSSGFRIAGKGQASNTYDHYLNRSGQDFYIDFERMNKEFEQAKQFKEDEIKNIKRAAELLALPGQRLFITSLLETTRIPGNVGMGDEWYLAVGNYRTWSSSIVSLNINLDGTKSYNADISYYFRDNYKWYDEAFGILKDFHRLNMGQEFKMHGIEEIDGLTWTTGKRYY